MTSRFAIVEMHTGFNNEKPMLPWRILELYYCFDGPRTRICMDAYATKEEAIEALQPYFEAIETQATEKFMKSVRGEL